MSQQVALLGALQQRAVTPVGGHKEIAFDARIVAVGGHLHGGDIEVYLDAGALAYRPAGEPEAGRKLA